MNSALLERFHRRGVGGHARTGGRAGPADRRTDPGDQCPDRAGAHRGPGRRCPEVVVHPADHDHAWVEGAGRGRDRGNLPGRDNAASPTGPEPRRRRDHEPGRDHRAQSRPAPQARSVEERKRCGSFPAGCRARCKADLAGRRRRAEQAASTHKMQPITSASSVTPWCADWVAVNSCDAVNASRVGPSTTSTTSASRF